MTAKLSGHEYADLIAAYILKSFGAKGLSVYREVTLGKTIIGKHRRIDVLVVQDETRRAIAIECKYQETQGTTDEKIPYTLQDMEAMGMPVCVVYAGDGFSDGILHVLQASSITAYALPDPEKLRPIPATRELDAFLAVTFQWWDLVLDGKRPFSLEDWKSKTGSEASIRPETGE